ncbi:MAG: hypothetical protein JXR31_01045, partial [Prolixibacteraceae bacterium]|nr:hypothetical protein [Prolixibacteraceae bacterium]
MIELAHFAHFLSFSIGLVAIYISVSLYKTLQLKAIKTYTAILLGINLIIFIHILEAFFKTIISDVFYDLWFRPVFWYLIFPLAVIRLFIGNRFLFFIYQLKNKKIPSWINNLFIGFLIVYILWIIIPFSDSSEIIHLNTYSITFIHFILFFSFVFGSFIQIRNTIKNEIIKKKWIKAVGWFFLFYAFILFLLRLINFPVHRMHEDIQMLGLGILALIFNLTNTLFLKKVFKTNLNIEEKNSRQVFFEKYKITNREQEIILLICEG